jgi:hypothetical protein
MTNEQAYDPQLALRQTIAGILDHPSVYMGGPSQQNLRRADRVIAALRADTRLMQALGAAEPRAHLPPPGYRPLPIPEASDSTDREVVVAPRLPCPCMAHEACVRDKLDGSWYCRRDVNRRDD